MSSLVHKVNTHTQRWTERKLIEEFAAGAGQTRQTWAVANDLLLEGDATSTRAEMAGWLRQRAKPRPVVDLGSARDAGRMSTVHQFHPQPEPGQVGYLAAIGVGVGDDDTVDAVAETECASFSDAVAWVERELPTADMPEWADRRPHGRAGVFLYGSVTRGYYTADDPPAWEPDGSDVSADGDLHDGVLHWRHRHPLPRPC